MESLELEAFSNQISALDKRIKNIESHEMHTQRYSATIDVANLLANFTHYLSHFDDNVTNRRAREYIVGRSNAVHQQIWASNDPIALTQQFRNDFASYCKDHGIDYFFEE